MDAENAAQVLSADHSSTLALTPHLLSSAFLSQQLKVLLHFLQVVKLRIDVGSQWGIPGYLQTFIFISAFIIYRPPSWTLFAVVFICCFGSLKVTSLLCSVPSTEQ